MVRTFHVVTPAFNSADYIERTLASVALQAGDFKVHHHVQDGGSADGTTDILRRWSHALAYGLIPQLNRGVHFTFTSQPDAGMYDAIAKGFASMGANPDDWMAWINSDDILMPGAMASLCAIDRELGTEQVAWLGGRTRNAHAHEVLGEVDHRQASGIIRHGLCDGLHFDLLQQEGCFFRTRVWNRIDPQADFASYDAAGDWNLWRLFAAHEEFFQLEFALGEFMQREGQKSALQMDTYRQEIEATIPFERRASALRKVYRSPPPRFVIKRTGSGGVTIETRETGPILQHWMQNKAKRETYRRTMLPGIRAQIIEKGLQRQSESPVEVLIGDGAERSDFLIHDADWQFPAITEQHAFHQARKLLPRGSGAYYLAFPWATLIDLNNHNRQESAEALRSKLKETVARAPEGARIVTVCQHIHLKRALHIMEDAGVTDVFWSHAQKSEKRLGKINVHPFPLYPVQLPDTPAGAERPYLFSFIGARPNEWYLTQVRAFILDHLSGNARGLVIGRDAWHYNKVVYEHQIREIADRPDGLVDTKASDEFKTAMQDSVFALCPSGSGPNSIRLWEALGAGTIPVILADTLAPSGGDKLWQEAAVFCEETAEAVKALPARLEALAADPDQLEAMRHAGRQLWSQYGPDVFVYDIQKLFHQLAGDPKAGIGGHWIADADSRIKLAMSGRHQNRIPSAYETLKPYLRDQIDLVDDARKADVLAVGFDIDLRENAGEILALKDSNARLQLAVLSEEPLWDTVWSAGYAQRDVMLTLQNTPVPVTVLNHITSNIYDFSAIPYFVTTSHDYVVRYANMMRRNQAVKAKDWLARWKAAAIPVAFFFENRENPKYDLQDDTHHLTGLCGYRTRLAKACSGDGILRAGKGWHSDAPRQKLPDWHLDKLTTLDGRTRMIGALENTHLPNYITEKIFDAYACGGIPVYWAAPGHRIFDIVPDGSFLNIYGLSEDEAARRIESFQPDKAFAARYVEAQKRLASLFCDVDLVDEERARIVAAIFDALVSITDRDGRG